MGGVRIENELPPLLECHQAALGDLRREGGGEGGREKWLKASPGNEGGREGGRGRRDLHRGFDSGYHVGSSLACPPPHEPVFEYA